MKSKQLLQLISIALGATLTLLPATAVAKPAVLSDTIHYKDYPYIIFVNNTDPISLSDEEFFDASGKIVFPVNQYALPQDSKMLQELEQTVLPMINRDSIELVGIMVRGTASPEGPVAWNNQLGRQRVKALSDFVSQRMNKPLADSMLVIKTDIEDYRSLCIMMRRAADPDYDLVQNLCNNLMDQDIVLLKHKLQTARQGRLWPRLLRTYFPSLRTARIVIFLKINEKTEPTETIETIVETEPAVDTEATKVAELTIDTISIRIPRRELLAVKTNLLLYGIYMPGYNRWCPIPNIALEYYPKQGHFTFGGSFDMPWWQDYDAHKYFQLRNYQLEARYYLHKSAPHPTPSSLTPHQTPNTTHQTPAYSGFYLQGYVHGGIFGICFDADRGWVGEGVGAGIGAGYVLPISKKGHWRLEFGAQAGFFICKYDPYQYENPVNPAYRDDLYYYKWTLKPELFKKRQYRWNWFGPTRLGITLSYDLLYRRIQKRGVSFRSTEEILVTVPSSTEKETTDINPQE